MQKDLDAANHLSPELIDFLGRLYRLHLSAEIDPCYDGSDRAYLCFDLAVIDDTFPDLEEVEQDD